MKLGLFTHTHPTEQAPGKQYRLVDGKPEKVTQGKLTEATYQTIEKETLADLAVSLNRAGPNMHITTGVSVHDRAAVRQAWKVAQDLNAGTLTDNDGLPLISRTKTDITHRKGNGVLVIDTDVSSDENFASMSVVWEALVAGIPALQGHAHILASSASSMVTHNGEQFSGIRGMHTFLHVKNATDIPRALRVMHKRMILAGHESHRLSSSGAFLNRSPVDLALRGPSQPVFLRSQMSDGIEQDKLVEHYDGSEVLDTENLIANLTQEEEARYSILVAEARLRMAEAGAAQREVYVTARSEAMAKAQDISTEKAREAILAALNGKTLGPDFMLKTAHGFVSVSEVLTNAERFHCQTCFDPIDHDESTPTSAIIYSDQNRPVVHSFTHSGGASGVIFRLTDERTTSGAAGQNHEEIEVAATKEAITKAKASLAKPRIDLGSVKSFLSAGDQLPDGVANLGRFYEATEAGDLEVVVADVADLTKWLVKEADADLRNDWLNIVAVHGNFTAATLELAVGEIAKASGGTPKKDVREALMLGLGSHRVSASMAADESVSSDADAEDVDDLLKNARRAGSLLEQCHPIAADPLGELEKALTAMGVVGERNVATFVFLVGVGANLRKPLSGIVRAQSSSGKSFVTTSVLALFADEVYTVSSMSAKALIYEPEGTFTNRLIFLAEGEALVRQDGEKNEVAEMLRVLLSEGHLKHSVPEKDPHTNAFVTKHYTMEGPTGLLTTTVRSHLDQEIETRMLSIWADESEAQTRSIVRSIGKRAEAATDAGPDLTAFHAYAKWVGLGPRRVIIPFGGALADNFASNAVRARRDINSVLSVISASALAHRLKRDVSDDGRSVIASIDDYRIAKAVLGSSIEESSGASVSQHAEEMLKALLEVVKNGVVSFGGWAERKAPHTAEEYAAALPYGTTPMKSKELEKAISDPVERKKVRACAECLGVAVTGDFSANTLSIAGSLRSLEAATGKPKSTISRYMSHLRAEGFITSDDPRRGQKQGPYTITLDGWRVALDEIDTASALPSPEDIADGGEK